MVDTRSTSRSDVPTVPTTAITTTNASVTATSANITGTIPRTSALNNTVVEARRHEELDISGGSISANSSIVTPPYSSISARGVIDAFNQHQVPLRPPPNQSHRRETARSITHEDLRNFEDRLLDLVPRIIQQSLHVHSQQRESLPNQHRNSDPFPDLSQPPPSFSNPSHRQLQVHQWPNMPFNQSNQVPFDDPIQSAVPMVQLPNGIRQQTLGANIRIDKWGIIFDGTNRTTSIEDFVFRVETLQNDYGCEWREVLKSFHHLLSGPALDWFWDHRRFNNVSRWRDLKAALISQFHRFDSDFDIHRKILDRRQQNQETFDDFYNAVIRLRNQLRSPISERDIVSIMKGNLKSPMAQLLFPVQSISLAQFAKECRRAENLLNNHRSFSNRFPPRSVHELDYEDVVAEETSEVDAFNTNVRKLICWNCKKEGHTFMECVEEKRNLFCYKCGLENTVTPKCPVCQGNLKTNMSRVGVETRSRMQYPKQQ